MLTNNEIQSAKQKGVLVPYTPPHARMGTSRAFLMSKSLYDEIVKKRTSDDRDVIGRWASLEGDILHFVTGGYINQDLLKQLDPAKYEHWCLRSVRPRPSLRLFGRFGRPDVFIGTHVVERNPLGGKWDFKWEYEKLYCEDDIWKKECQLPERPYSGDKYTDYITSNAHKTIRVK